VVQDKSQFKLGRVEIGLLIAVALAIIATGFLAWRMERTTQASIQSFEECVEAGNPVMESFPEQCAANGQTWSNPKQKAPILEEVDTLPTDSWVTYSGLDMNLKHPETWAVSAELENSEEEVNIVSPDFIDVRDLGPSVGAGHRLELDKFTIDETSFKSYEEHLTYLGNMEDECDGDYATTQVGGLPSVVSDIKCHGSYRSAYVYKDNHYYVISLHALDEDTTEFKQLFATILDTVTFE